MHVITENNKYEERQHRHKYLNLSSGSGREVFFSFIRQTGLMDRINIWSTLKQKQAVMQRMRRLPTAPENQKGEEGALFVRSDRLVILKM